MLLGMTPKDNSDEQAAAREASLARQAEINVVADKCKDAETRVGDSTEKLADHNKSFFWFTRDDASGISFYYAGLCFFLLLCFVDVVFIGLSATDDLLKAVVLPVTFLIGETLLLCRLVFKTIELVGNKWPVDMRKIAKDDLKLGSEYGTLNLVKNIVVLLFGLWAFVLMVDVHRYEMTVERMIAADEAPLSGAPAEYEMVGFATAAMDDILPWVYGCVALFLHWVYTRFQTLAFLTVSYFIGFRRKYKKLTRSIQNDQALRRHLLTAIGTSHGRHLDDNKEAEKLYPGYCAPEENLSPTALRYLAEYRKDFGSEGDSQGDGQAEPAPPVLRQAP